jgi:hypothetical protein
MLRLLATWLAKQVYVFRLEFNGSTNELQAKLAAFNAAERRRLIETLNQEADEIEKNIEIEEAKPE